MYRHSDVCVASRALAQGKLDSPVIGLHHQGRGAAESPSGRPGNARRPTILYKDIGEVTASIDGGCSERNVVSGRYLARALGRKNQRLTYRRDSRSRLLVEVLQGMFPTCERDRAAQSNHEGGRPDGVVAEAQPSITMPEWRVALADEAIICANQAILSKPLYLCRWHAEPSAVLPGANSRRDVG